jgi:hypothetical protein
VDEFPMEMDEAERWVVIRKPKPKAKYRHVDRKAKREGGTKTRDCCYKSYKKYHFNLSLTSSSPQSSPNVIFLNVHIHHPPPGGYSTTTADHPPPLLLMSLADRTAYYIISNSFCPFGCCLQDDHAALDGRQFQVRALYPDSLCWCWRCCHKALDKDNR